MTTAAQIGQLYAICVPHTIAYTGTPGASADLFALEHAYNFDDSATATASATATIAPASGSDRRGRKAEERFEFRAPREHEMRRDRPILRYRRREAEPPAIGPAPGITRAEQDARDLEVLLALDEDW